MSSSRRTNGTTPLIRRYPGKHVARLKIWFPENRNGLPAHSSIGFEGKIPRQLADLIVEVLCARQAIPAELAELQNIADRLDQKRSDAADRELREARGPSAPLPPPPGRRKARSGALAAPGALGTSRRGGQ